MLVVDREARFWSKVDRASDGCWLWTAGSREGRYGAFWTGTHTVRAHRYAYLLTYGTIPAGRVVCHTCDNPLCVRPAHLFLGTQKENMQDCARKGRKKATAARGARNPAAKLSEEDVLGIVQKLGGRSLRSLAREYEVTHFTIAAVRDGLQWGHVTGRGG